MPQGFVGVDADGPLFGAEPAAGLGAQIAPMVAAGVQSIRVAFSWASAQPYPAWSSLTSAQQAQFTDVDGVPTDFRQTDLIVGDAALLHLAVLPIVLYAPPWDAGSNPGGFQPPADPAPYAAYLTALIARYGPNGAFWRDHPGLSPLPITQWQIWNEPNIQLYWPQPFASGYVKLLRAANAAVKAADPSAKVVLGALTNYAWNALASILKIPGAAGQFDEVAVNGFTARPSDVILYLLYMRRALNKFGYRATPLLATELSWPSALGKVRGTGYDFDTTEAGQAANIATLLPLLGRDRARLGLAGFYYYTWMSAEQPGSTNPFSYGGLLALRGGRIVIKPALAAFKRAALALEGCASKGSLATDCIR